ncbi:GroES-like protein [Podospora aff. communis PSN243]|uniref:GroES-like protein n=1 Tax=Podospora aff. communis PSN243 TaxID=3040156 RepID=A0AAV9G4K5_9PEZI|nr:GroES-like protein [Podospora aff. communis PSN243]
MAQNLAGKLAEKALGHVSNPAREGGKYADESGERMKALVWMGNNDVRSKTPKPGIIDDHDVIVQVAGSTVCGSDVHLMHGVIVQTEKGDILGHEFIGRVESVGPAVAKLSPGDRVVNSFCISWGECRYSKAKLPTACERTNASRLNAPNAEFVRVPLADNNLLKLPDSVPDEKGLYLSDVLPTSYHAVTYTGVKEGDIVAIWGLGPIGFMACYWAKKRGAKRVIGIDNNWRTDYAKAKIPGVETINYEHLKSDQTVPNKVHELVPGGVDVSIDATGGEYGKSFSHKVELATGMEQDTSEMINEAIYSTRKFGKVGVIGDYVGFTNHFNIGAVMELGITLVGCGQAPVQKYWEELLKMVKNGEVDPTIMLTHRIGLDDIDKAYKLQEQRAKGLVKCFVETRFSGKRLEGTPELTRL